MANKAQLPFYFRFEGDGVSTSVSINMLTGPVFFQTVGQAYPILNPTLSIVGDIDNADLSVGGLTISSSSFLLGTLTVNFTSAPASETLYYCTGVVEF